MLWWVFLNCKVDDMILVNDFKKAVLLAPVFLPFNLRALHISNLDEGVSSNITNLLGLFFLEDFR